MQPPDVRSLSPRMPTGHPRERQLSGEPEGIPGEGRGEGQPQTSAQIPAPHPNPLPASGEREHDAHISARDPDGTIWLGGTFHRDTWAKAGVDDPLPDGPVIVRKTRWLAERDRLLGRNAPLGLLISAGETVDDIADDLPRFALIALDFPKFADGRAFSTARLLREKHGYAGELRAVGDVLADPIPLMRRVGFDSFEVTNGPTRRAE